MSLVSPEPGRWVLIAPPGKPLPYYTLHARVNSPYRIRFQLFFFLNATAGTENIFARSEFIQTS